jgi:hypothetical protein
MKRTSDKKSRSSFKKLLMAAGALAVTATVAEAKDLPNLFIIEEESSIEIANARISFSDKSAKLFTIDVSCFASHCD